MQQQVKTKQNKKMLNVNQQLLTSFPNRNDKHIDYVIVYDKLDENEFYTFDNQQKHAVRRAFFDRLTGESFDIYQIEHKKCNRTKVFTLLHCSTERLLEEAELIRLEMILKNVSIISFFSKLLT